MQESCHNRDGKLQVCPTRNWSDQRENEGETQEELEARCGGVGPRDDPLREQQKRWRENGKIVNREMGSEEHGGEQQGRIAQR